MNDLEEAEKPGKQTPKEDLIVSAAYLSKTTSALCAARMLSLMLDLHIAVRVFCTCKLQVMPHRLL